MNQIHLSANFKKATTKSIAAIVLFIVTYVLLVCAAVALTIGLTYLAYLLIKIKLIFVTAALALVLVSIGILSLIFLFKFIFTRNVTNLTGLIEIKEAQMPELFAMIEQITKQVGTDMPKKVYLSDHVNASVFYDSSFWSMFLPVRKNLQIGLGLVNTLSVSELKAVLAHEFGHFSQKTMKVGSYVYNVNRIIYNMLYENESYQGMLDKWATISSYFDIAIATAGLIVKFIQWVLRKVYYILNLNYMGLSREMEFHADQVAAHVAGSDHLSSALLRMDLADHAYQSVIEHYQQNPDQLTRPENLYQQQAFVMNFIAAKQGLPIENGLAQLGLDYINRYKSKLILTDQWSSHPSTEDRVLQLNDLNIKTSENDNRHAFSVFRSSEVLQEKFSIYVFKPDADQQVTTVNQQQFEAEYQKQYDMYAFSDIYNQYYDYRSIQPFELNPTPDLRGEAVDKLNDLFGSEKVGLKYEYSNLENEIATLQQIELGNYLVKSFDYDGNKYTPADCPALISSLNSRLNQVTELLKENDLAAYRLAWQRQTDKTQGSELTRLYQSFFHVSQRTTEAQDIFVNIADASGFIFETTLIKDIPVKLQTLKAVEPSFKEQIRNLLAEPEFLVHVTEDARKNFDNYLAEDFQYFVSENYNSEQTDTLMGAINNYRVIIAKTHFDSKKALLDYQAMLLGDDSRMTKHNEQKASEANFKFHTD